jgi:F-type H+-transporting ATPase subunit delta
MNHSKIGVRYAKALIELASEKDKLDTVYQDLLNAEQIIFDKAVGLYEVLTNPIIKPSLKLHFVEKIFSGNVDTITLDFLLLVVKKGREQYFDSIFRNFYKQYNEVNKIKRISITTVVKPDEQVVAKIKKLAQTFIDNDYKVEVTEFEDKSLIGGFLLEVDDFQFDATVKTKLQKIKSELSNSSYKIKL